MVKRMIVIFLNRNLCLRIFGRIYLSFFLYISIVKLQWPAASSKYNCKNHITDFSLEKKHVNKFASKGRLIYYSV